MCYTRLAENARRKKSPCMHHPASLSGSIFTTRHISTIGKKMLNSNISSTCPHNMVNFGPLAAEIVSRVCDTPTPANLNGIRVLASLLHRRRSTEVNQTLDDVWPSPRLVHQITDFGTNRKLICDFLLLINTNFPPILHRFRAIAFLSLIHI